MHPETAPDPTSCAALSWHELVARYAVGVDNFDRRVLSLHDAQLDTAFRPEAGVGRWPARVLLGHLADAELMQAHRMRRAFAEDGAVVALWDENAFIDAGIYGTPETGPAHPVGAFLAVIHATRQWMATWLRTLDDPARGRAILHPERGRLTIRALLEHTTWHLEHHAWFLNRKVARFLGDVARP